MKFIGMKTITTVHHKDIIADLIIKKIQRDCIILITK